jgi:hypothetical protein
MVKPYKEKGGFLVKKNGIGKKVFAILLMLCMMLTIIPANADAATIGEVDEPILYQIRNNADVRFIAYIDDYKAYSSVSFTLTIDGKVSKPLVCTIAYSGLYAEGDVYKTVEIYEEEGYLTTFTVNDYISYYGGQEVTVTATYTTVTGETIEAERTVVIGEKQIISGDLTYANAYDWSANSYQKQIYVYASATETATPATINGQAVGFMGWFSGIVFEYNETNGTWKVVSVNWGDGTNEAESTTLGDGRLIVMFHNDVVNGQPENYNFFKEKAVVGAEFYLSEDISILQSVSGSLSNVYLSLKPHLS